MRSENELPSARSISAVSVDSKWCWPSGICARTENDRPCLWREREGWRDGERGGEGGQRLTHRCAQASQLHTEQVVKRTALLHSLSLSLSVFLITPHGLPVALEQVSNRFGCHRMSLRAERAAAGFVFFSVVDSLVEFASCGATNRRCQLELKGAPKVCWPNGGALNTTTPSPWTNYLWQQK